MSNKTASSSGIGFFGMLTVLFIGLKLTGYINWSWLWVLSPAWLPVTLLLAVCLIVMIIAAAMDNSKARKREGK